MMNRNILLPPALSGDKKDLSSEAKLEIQSLCGNRPIQFIFQALMAWATMIAVVSLAIYLNNIWMTLLAIFIVATRLNVLGLLAHDQTHWLGVRGRYGDMIANILTAYPLGITVEEYARVHLSHHRYYFSDQDPDFSRKSGPNWTFPMPYTRLTGLLLSDLLGLSFIRLLKGKRFKNKSVYKRTHASPAWLRPSYYLTILAVTAYFNAWHILLLYWVVPLVTLIPLIFRFGAICEHVYGSPKATIIDSSPLILLKWWEKLLLPNLNFTLHAYHHFYPSVAFCNLPKVHKIYQRENLINEENVFHGYWSYIRFLQTPHEIPISEIPTSLIEQKAVS